MLVVVDMKTWLATLRACTGTQCVCLVRTRLSMLSRTKDHVSAAIRKPCAASTVC
jgi:hypothetical protein